MYDYHLHTTVSYDGLDLPVPMAQRAIEMGLQEICFTDHLDYEKGLPKEQLAYPVERYNTAYDGLHVPGIRIRNGVEIGMTPWNAREVEEDLGLRHYDFVLGSVHHVDNRDIYFAEYWEGRDPAVVEWQYFEEMLQCVQLHDNFDVLGHLTYVAKTRGNPHRRIIPLAEYRSVVEEIMKELIRKDKGMEINTSGMGRVGDFLPGREYLQLFKDLGGCIITTGSDAHNTGRVGEHIAAATELARDVFGHVCTFEDRKVIFHKL